ncbi:hypothetical protein [Streptomyces sp. NPDC017448]|uniref:hypothetical protein n=1 Tax=Streptomyces sp. NPDC017448 TaxID=3364996 RepID=UPI00379DA8D9
MSKLSPHVSLWRYEINATAHDCDGEHHRESVLISHEDPDRIVFSRGTLFAPGGPSAVHLTPMSTENKGWASIGNATDEGGRGWSYHWERVTDRTVLDTYLQEVEEGRHSLPQTTLERLVRYRSLALVQEAFPDATGIGVNPAPPEGKLWEITDIFGDPTHAPKTLWAGPADECPLPMASVKRISGDLEFLYTNELVEYGSYVRLH